MKYYSNYVVDRGWVDSKLKRQGLIKNEYMNS